MAAQLRQLRERADEDFASPPGVKVAGRHQVDIAELGLRVAVTRSRYPNREDGVDQYAVTLTRSRLDQAPAGQRLAQREGRRHRAADRLPPSPFLVLPDSLTALRLYLSGLMIRSVKQQRLASLLFQTGSQCHRATSDAE